MGDLVKLIHGSFDSKSKLIDDFNEMNPECSKNSIERKIKEFFVKFLGKSSEFLTSSKESNILYTLKGAIEQNVATYNP